MLKSQAVAQYLPFLRRYARALAGNQTSGDAYVGATLEALIEDPKVIDDTGGPRVALYRLFTKIWSSVGLNAEGSPITELEMSCFTGEYVTGTVTPEYLEWVERNQLS